MMISFIPIQQSSYRVFQKFPGEHSKNTEIGNSKKKKLNSRICNIDTEKFEIAKVEVEKFQDERAE